jgi:hypothetical protein
MTTTADDMSSVQLNTQKRRQQCPHKKSSGSVPAAEMKKVERDIKGESNS